MTELSKHATIYLDPALHQALHQALREDQEDLTAFAERVAESIMSYP